MKSATGNPIIKHAIPKNAGRINVQVRRSVFMIKPYEGCCYEYEPYAGSNKPVLRIRAKSWRGTIESSGRLLQERFHECQHLGWMNLPLFESNHGGLIIDDPYHRSGFRKLGKPSSVLEPKRQVLVFHRNRRDLPNGCLKLEFRKRHQSFHWSR